MRKNNILILLIGVFAMLFTSCRTGESLTYFQNADEVGESIRNEDYAIEIVPADELFISVNSLVPEATAIYNLPLSNPAQAGSLELTTSPKNQTYIVNKDGNIQFPVLGQLHVAGMTIHELTEMLTKEISKDVENPIVRVQLMNFRVNVLGEVKNPGQIVVTTERFSIFDALATVGDLTEYGRREKVTLIREVDGVRTYHRINLNDANVVNSPYFYLQQNDVIYVEPNKVRKDNSKYNQNNSFRIQVVSTVVSLASVISSLLIALVINNR